MNFSKNSSPFLIQNQHRNEINKIPKKNKKKFLQHLVVEIKKAQEVDYE